MNTLCACGCGKPTSVWTRNQASLGRVKGEHAKWISGHHRRTRQIVDGKLRCKDCGKWKLLTDFHQNKNMGRIDRASYCKACHHHRARWYTAVLKYGLSYEAYQVLLAAQGGKCAICLKPPLAGKTLNVDHCHDSGKVRGLLCRPCNTGLGSFKDNAGRLRRAITYLA